MKKSPTDHLARSRRNRFTAVRLNREVELRDDLQWVSKTLQEPSTRLVPLWRSRSLLERGDEGTLAVYLSPTELSEPDRIQPPTLLGHDGKREYFAVSVRIARKTPFSNNTRPLGLQTCAGLRLTWSPSTPAYWHMPRPCITGSTAMRFAVSVATLTCCARRDIA